jgi:hypothetical protein
VTYYKGISRKDSVLRTKGYLIYFFLLLFFRRLYASLFRGVSLMVLL